MSIRWLFSGTFGISALSPHPPKEAGTGDGGQQRNSGHFALLLRSFARLDVRALPRSSFEGSQRSLVTPAHLQGASCV